MNEPKDRLTDITNRALDLLLTKHPARTSIGVMLGLVCAFLVELFLPVLKEVQFANFAGVPKWGWIPVGILVAHLPTLFCYIENIGHKKKRDHLWSLQVRRPTRYRYPA